ncbi:MAG: GDSL-type esterase/lipase family protein [Flavisolibacter sp.]
MKEIKGILLILVLGIMSCGDTKKIGSGKSELTANELQPYGRYLRTNDMGIELISTAVHFGFTFTGNQCQVFLSVPDKNTHGYIQYELDGEYQKRMRIESTGDQPLVLKAPNGGKHSIWIYKTTEASSGPIYIKKVIAKNIKTLDVPVKPLIEFIGNSITCGAASDASEMPCDSGNYHDHHNAYYAYGPRVARALGTNFIISSVSGIGIYRNWNSDGPTMPQVYEKAELQEDHSELWNFSRYSPNIVSIALGTNDFSRGDGKKERLPFDSAAFVSNYINFVKLVKSKYKNAQIALLSSPMIRDKNALLFEHCLKAVKFNIDEQFPKDKPVAIYLFQPMVPNGCYGHPGVEDHGVMANELIPFFKKLL